VLELAVRDQAGRLATERARAEAAAADERRRMERDLHDGGCDGRGGADLRAGTGLRGLAERVSTVGGRLVVSDRRPNGTRLEVTLPCAP
jgi:signal transduction histidine kinase